MAPSLRQHVDTGEGYRRWSVVYDEQPNPITALEQRIATPLLPEVHNKSVLDLGCGTGRWLRVLADKRPLSLVGIDSSSEMLERAKRGLPRWVQLEKQDASATAFDEASFDFIISSFVCSYVGDVDAYVQRIARSLKPTGEALISDLHPETTARFKWTRGFRDERGAVALTCQNWSLDYLSFLFERAGLVADILLEPAFGAEERDLFERAGRLHVFETVATAPAIYIMRLRRKSLATYSPTPLRHIANAKLGLSAEVATLASITLSDGLVSRVASHSSETPSIDLSDHLVVPGLINAHDHLEFALFPQLGRGKYSNYQHWASDIHERDASTIRKHRRVPKRTRLLWGALKNLLSGTTTVCHHNPYEADLFTSDFPVTVPRIEWAHSLAFAKEQMRLRHTSDRPFIIHAAEGVDAIAASEIGTLAQQHALRDGTVIVHGLGTSHADRSLLRERGVQLIWCPSSNTQLYGKTLSFDDLREFPDVALGTDSSLSCPGDLLDEINFAAHETNAAYTYDLVTKSAARILRLAHGSGTLLPGAPADLVAFRDRGLSPAQALASSSYRGIECVIVGGRIRLASAELYARLPEVLQSGLVPLEVDGLLRWVRAPLGQMFSHTVDFLGCDFTLGGKRIRHVSSMWL